MKCFNHLFHCINFSLEGHKKVRCVVRFGNDMLVAAEISKLAEVVESKELAKLWVALSACL